VRVAWTLEELGVPFDLVVMNSEEGQAEAHRARHPLRRVPVLEDDEGFVFESVAICLHLADLRAGGGLLPEPGTHERALVYQWAVFVPAELEPPLIEAARQATRDPERAERARARLDAAIAAIAGALDGRDYVVGDQFTIADIFVSSALGFTRRAGFWDELPPHLRAYVERVEMRPARQRAAAALTGSTA
jgi:glutathione S-transferase